MEYPEPSDEVPTELKACGICNRTFRPEALGRHEKVCQKNAAKKRKVFDSSKQRALEDAPAVAKAPAKTVTKQPPSKPKGGENKPKPSKSNWREKHEELIETIKKARVKDDGKSSSDKENKRKVPSDYVQCPGCERHFNQRAAERHIPWCKEKKSQTPKSAAKDEAKEKLIARVKYRPPQGKSRLLNRKTKSPNSVQSPETKQQSSPPPAREKLTHSSPAILDNRQSRNSSLDRANNNVIYSKRRSGSRSREKEPISSPELPQHIIKFKEKFPNHNYKRNVDLEETLTTQQLRELLSCSRSTDRIPRTVPGVRLSSDKNHNDNWNYSWNKRLVDKPTLPEVSSSELPGTWAGKMCWNGDLDQSMSSTGSSSGGSSSGSLPPLSRESTDDTPLAFYCHQCNSKFPLIGAKYCCECGARRRGQVCINQTG